MALDFPASSASPFTAPNGVIYTWNAAGYWEAKADPNDFDSDYLKLDATNGPVTGDLTLNEDLNVGDDLTVAGTSDFTGVTTHEGGIDVGSSREIFLNSNGNSAFSGRVVVGGFPFEGAVTGSSLESSGKITAGRDREQDLIFVGHTTGNSSETFSVSAGGEAYFGGKTTHEAGVKVTGGNLGIVNTGIYQINNNLDICFKGDEVAQFYDNGTGTKCWTFGAPQDPNIGFNVRSSPAVFQPTGAATQAGNQFRTYVADNAKTVNNIVSAISLDEAAVLDSYNLFNGNLTTESGKGPLNTATVYYAGSALNTDKYMAKNNYGFYSNIYNNAVGNNNFNFYAAGTARNYFKGTTVVSSTTDSTGDILRATHNGMYFNSESGGIAVTKLDSSTTATVMQCARGGGAATRRFIDFRFAETAGSPIGWIDATASTVSYRETSDYRLKENIVPLASASDRLKELKPCTFNFIGQDEVVEGFIAHEIQQVAPASASGTKDEEEAIGTLADYDGTVLQTAVTEPSADDLTYTEEVETDGVATMVTRTRTWTPTGNRPVYQGVDQTKLIPLLTKALQEALERIEVLEAAAGGTTRKKK